MSDKKLGPIEIEFLLDKKAEEQAQRLKGTLESVAKAGEKGSVAYNKELKRESGLIADIEKELVKLRELKKNAHSIEDIERYNRKIQEAELHLKEYNEAGKNVVETNKAQETSHNKIIESLRRWGIGLLTVTGLMKLFNGIINSSSEASDNFRFMVDGVKGALQQLSQALIPSANQTGRVIDAMIEGFKNSKELAKAIDAYNEALGSSQVLEAKELRRLKELEASWRNGANDIEVRKRDLDEWIVIKKEAAARELKIEQDLNNALIKEIQNRPNLKAEELTRAQIERFTTIYATNSELIQKAEEYWAAFNKLNLRGEAVGFNEKQTEYYANLKKEIEGLIPQGMKWNDVMQFAQIKASLNNDQVKALRESFARLYEAQAGGAEVEAEVARWMGALQNKGEKAAEEINDLNLQISNLKEKLITASEAERGEIAKKILLLERELEVRKKIVEQAIMVAQFQALGIPEKVTANFSLPSVLPDTKPKPKPWDQVYKEMNTLRPSQQGKINEDEKKRRKDISESDQERLENSFKLINNMGELTGILAEQGILTEDAARSMDMTLMAIGKFLSGDTAGAVMTMASQVISALQYAFPNVMEKESSRLQAKIYEINKLLEEQQRILDKSERFGGESGARREELRLYQQKIDANNEAIARYQKIVNSEWKTPKARFEAYSAIQQLREENRLLQQEIEESELALKDLISGGVTENTLADMFTEAFRSGKTSARDFADFTKQIMQDAVLNVFKAQILGPALTEAQGLIGKALGDGILTNEELTNINNLVAGLGERYKNIWDPLAKALGFDQASSENTMTGAIKGITSDQASVLGGQVNAIRITQADSNGIMKRQLLHLAKIEDNTSYLKSIDSKLDALKTDSLRAQGL